MSQKDKEFFSTDFDPGRERLAGEIERKSRELLSQLTLDEKIEIKDITEIIQEAL